MVGVPLVCAMDARSDAETWIGSRQLYGLWALSFLLVAMISGPLTAVFPRLPVKPHLILGRRAVGISCFALGCAHALSYSVPAVMRGGVKELLAPGQVWTLGLLLGAFGLALLGVLTWTSTDHQLIRVGPKRWKRWQESVYWLLPLLFIHAKIVGTDFGAQLAPDVKAEPDMGAFLGMSAFAAAWLALFVLRRRGKRWA